MKAFSRRDVLELGAAGGTTHTPAALVAQQLNIAPAVRAKFPGNQPGIVPA
jgi:oxalate decarboxylase